MRAFYFRIRTCKIEKRVAEEGAKASSVWGIVEAGGSSRYYYDKKRAKLNIMKEAAAMEATNIFEDFRRGKGRVTPRLELPNRISLSFWMTGTGRMSKDE